MSSFADQWLVHQIHKGTTSSVTSTNPPPWLAAQSNYMVPSVQSSAQAFFNTVIHGNQLIVNSYIVDHDDYGACDDYTSSRDIRIVDGEEKIIHLPDGSRIEVKADASYEIIDKDAKVIYRACKIRNFNPFLNASDKLEEFIRYCGTVGVRQSEMMRLPLELFVAWLVISAARQDNEPEPDLPLVPRLKSRAVPRCTGCGRFLSRALREKRLDYCAPRCFEVHYERASDTPLLIGQESRRCSR